LFLRGYSSGYVAFKILFLPCIVLGCVN
jgi:hypothetical protein